MADEPPKSHDEAFWQFSSARKVEGGIKAQRQRRGKQPEAAWWAQRWIAVLESFDIGGRLERGRSYARRGQVLSIDIQKGEVLASVQGSRRQPYTVSIKLAVLTAQDWQRLAGEFTSKAVYAAKLLARQMPPQIEDAFAAVGLSLFPSKHADLKTQCSCPDWSNPCKHIAAVYYLIGEEFDRDPFLIFRLRGLGEEELMPLLDRAIAGDEADRATQALPGSSKARRRTASETKTVRNVDIPISTEHARFWRMSEPKVEMRSELHAPTTHAVSVRSLGAFPFWRGEVDLWSTLEHAYRQASTSVSGVMSELMAENTKAVLDEPSEPV